MPLPPLRSAASDLDDGLDALAGEWDSPVTRLALLLELADEPKWLREMAAVRGSSTGESEG